MYVAICPQFIDKQAVDYKLTDYRILINHRQKPCHNSGIVSFNPKGNGLQGNEEYD